MTKLLEKREGSKGQLLWVVFVRIIGFIMFVAPIYKPVKSYFLENIENVTLNGTDWLFSCVGLVLFSGGKNIAVLINNIGIGIMNLINKVTK